MSSSSPSPAQAADAEDQGARGGGLKGRAGAANGNRGPLFLKLRLPPSVNALYRNVRGVGRVKTTAYKVWVRDAHYSVIAQVTPPRMIDPPYSIDLRVPERMRGDVDGRIKATLDALVRASVLTDDSAVCSIAIRRDPEVSAGQIHVSIQTIGEKR